MNGQDLKYLYFEVHVMRDHPAHTASIMGGMWGAKAGAVRTQLRRSFSQMFRNGVSYVDRKLGGWDQIALERWQLIIIKMFVKHNIL